MKKNLIYILTCFFITILSIGIYHYFIGYQNYRYTEELIESTETHTNESFENFNIENINQEIEELKSKYEELKSDTYFREEEIQAIFATYEKANLFLKSYLNHDVNTIKSLVSDNVSVNEENIIYKFNDSEIDINYLPKNQKYTFQLNGSGLDETDINTNRIAKKVIYSYILFNDKKPTAFINIEFKRNIELWEIDSISFDI